MSDYRFTSKISAASLGFDKKSIRKKTEEADGQSVAIYEVYGKAVKTRKGITKGKGNEEDNEWTAFIGQFEAVNIETGELVRSGEVFLPSMITPWLESQLINIDSEIVSENDLPMIKGVEFAFSIGVKENTKTATDYEFTATNLMAETEGDMLTLMRDKFSTKVLESN